MREMFNLVSFEKEAKDKRVWGFYFAIIIK
jgi:hypothetical protein